MPRPRVTRWLLAALLLPLAAVAALALLLWLRVPAAAPLVQRSEPIAPADVERALQLARVHDPRSAIPGVLRTLRLTQHEAELLLNHAAARVLPSRWQLDLSTDQLQLQGSLRLPPPWDQRLGGPWVNLQLQAHATRGLPVLDSVTLGRLPLPVPLVEWAWARALQHAGLDAGAGPPPLTVQQVRLRAKRLDLVYAWGPDAPARALALLLPAHEHERLRVYANELVDLAARLPAQPTQALSQLLPPLFELARRRSAEGQNPALENRAALLVLGMAANGIGLGVLLPERQAELAARPIRVTLAGRRDAPQHFLVSATLAAESGAPLADRIGLFKELADSRGGTGFSFNDMAANRAGTRLGALAVGNPTRLQQRLAGALQEDDLLPDVSDLPEGMNEAEFRRRYGAPGSPAYQQLMDDIEQRLEATPALR